MPRGRDDMQVNVAGLRRNIKNLAHNYSDAQVKVREATSNDPWGPSSTLMAEIADLTYNVMAFTEIMQMIWKRLNDHGKNWRHVYKALVLMEYLIKTGSEKVAMQCKENIFAIHTLKDFQYMEEGKDQGLNVREKAKQLVNLLKDEERLKNERTRALKAKQRFAQSASAFGSDGALDTPSSPTYPPDQVDSVVGSGSGSGSWSGRDAELARPLTAGEEELQLQLALAMSREEAEKDERRRRSDDVRLQLALSQSQNDFQLENLRACSWALASRDEWRRYGYVGCVGHILQTSPVEKSSASGSHLLDLVDVGSAPTSSALDPWGLPAPAPAPVRQDTSSDAWSAVGSPAKDPWAAAPPAAPAAPADPWAPLTQSKSPPLASASASLSSPSSAELEQFDALSQRPRDDPFDLALLGENLNGQSSVGAGVKKSPSAFLGENSSLVNLERLLAAPDHNPFAHDAHAAHNAPRSAFAPPPPPKLSINELKQQQMGLTGLSFPHGAGGFGAGMAPMPSSVPLAPMASGASLLGAPAAGAPLLGAPAAGAPLLGAPLPGAPAADPWAPVPAPRAQSPWATQRHTPNPFLS